MLLTIRAFNLFFRFIFLYSYLYVSYFPFFVDNSDFLEELDNIEINKGSIDLRSSKIWYLGLVRWEKYRLTLNSHKLSYRVRLIDEYRLARSMWLIISRKENLLFMSEENHTRRRRGAEILISIFRRMNPPLYKTVLLQNIV